MRKNSSPCAFRISPWRRFFEEAEKQPWFRNTIFAIFGDHGLYHAPTFTPAGLSGLFASGMEHAAPAVRAGRPYSGPGKDEAPHSQLDIFPTLASLTGVPFRSNTLGRNMLAPGNDQNAMVFISENITRMLIKDGYIYRNTPESLYRLVPPSWKTCWKGSRSGPTPCAGRSVTSMKPPNFFCTITAKPD